MTKGQNEDQIYMWQLGEGPVSEMFDVSKAKTGVTLGVVPKIHNHRTQKLCFQSCGVWILGARPTTVRFNFA